MSTLQQSICTVVVESTLCRFLVALDEIQQSSDWIELRVDFIQNLSVKDIDVIRQHTHKKAIFCCRATREGGQFLGSTEAQRAILQKANDLGFEYIDIDLAKAKELTIENKMSKQIISYHDYQKTPSLTTLNELRLAMQSFQPDVLKFAVTITCKHDCNELIRFLLTKKSHEHLIVLGMGDAGKKLRILAPLLGGYLTFAAVGGSRSAPGQIELQDLRALYQRIDMLLS